MSKPASILRPIWFLLICPLILILLGPLATALSPVVAPLAVGTIATVFTLLLTKAFVRWDGLKLKDVGAAVSRQSVSRMIGGVLIGAALVAVQILTVKVGGHAHWVVGEQQSLATVMLMIAGYIALASREELAFRGYPLRRLEAAWGMWPALVFISAIFAIEHVAAGMNWWQLLIGTFLGGLMFGMAAQATRGLAVPLGIHCGFNSGQWLMGQKGMPGVWKAVVDTGFAGQAEALGYIGYAVGTLVIALGFWLWSWKANSSRRQAVSA